MICTWTFFIQSNMDFSTFSFLQGTVQLSFLCNVSQRGFLEKDTSFSRPARPSPSVTDRKWDAIRLNTVCSLKYMNNWNSAHTYLSLPLCLPVTHQWPLLQTYLPKIQMSYLTSTLALLFQSVSGILHCLLSSIYLSIFSP